MFRSIPMTHERSDPNGTGCLKIPLSWVRSVAAAEESHRWARWKSVTSRAHMKNLRESAQCDERRGVWQVKSEKPSTFHCFRQLGTEFKFCGVSAGWSLSRAPRRRRCLDRLSEKKRSCVSPDCQSWPNLFHYSGPTNLECFELNHTHVSFGRNVYLCHFVVDDTFMLNGSQRILCGALLGCQFCRSVDEEAQRANWTICWARVFASCVQCHDHSNRSDHGPSTSKC